MKNFKQIEPAEFCPPNIQVELVSEMDTIRNSLQVVELYIGDFLNVISSLYILTVTPPPSYE